MGIVSGLCLPRDDVVESLRNKYFIYFTELKDILNLMNKVLKLPNIPIFLSCRGFKFIHCMELSFIVSEYFKAINPKVGLYQGTGDSSSLVGQERFLSNCSDSLFLSDMQKEVLCKQSLQVLLLKFFVSENIQQNNINITSISKYSCKPNCPPGKFLQFNHTIFTWGCRECVGNTYKSQFGSAKCTPCERGWDANKNKTLCFDTYKNITLLFSDSTSIIMLAASGTLFSAISASIFFFIKFRDTPLVKSSNRILSAIQISSQLSLVLILPFIYIGIPNIVLCFI